MLEVSFRLLREFAQATHLRQKRCATFAPFRWRSFRLIARGVNEVVPRKAITHRPLRHVRRRVIRRDRLWGPHLEHGFGGRRQARHLNKGGLRNFAFPHLGRKEI
jgi:hypothetical protein